MARASWVDYFLGIADVVATRATCDRRHVGAVMVRDNKILCSGYNGSAASLDHCDDVGHDMVEGHCQRTVHAEINAICQAARHGVALDGATLYCTDLPCWSCFKALVNAGITRVFYRERYRPDPRVLDAADKTRMFLAHIPRDTPDAQTDKAVITPDDVTRMAQESAEISKAMQPRIETMWKVDPADVAKPCRQGEPSHPGPTWRQVELARAFSRGLHRLDFTAPEIEAEVQAELDLDEENYRGLAPCGQCKGEGWEVLHPMLPGVPITKTSDSHVVKTECRVCHGTGVDPESRHHEESQAAPW